MCVSGLHCVLVPYLSLPCEQLKIRLGGSLSLVLSGSEYYASPIPYWGLNKKKSFAIQYNALAGGLPADNIMLILKGICGYLRI